MSFNQRLFLKINGLAGRYKSLDLVMYLCAHWLIYALIFLVLTWGEITLGSSDFKLFIKLLLTAIFAAISASWLLAIFWPHPRPIIELAETKLLVHPAQNWKSFPSDHTTLSFLLVFIAFLSGANYTFTVLFVVLATLVAIGRICAGVHYPRDIVGGFLTALSFSLLASWLVLNITQPIYNLLLTIL